MYGTECWTRARRHRCRFDFASSTDATRVPRAVAWHTICCGGQPELPDREREVGRLTALSLSGKWSVEPTRVAFAWDGNSWKLSFVAAAGMALAGLLPAAVTTTNHLFDGARADMTKVLSPQDPAFQVTHAFSMGSVAVPPTYSFGAVYIGEKTFLQGTIDTDSSLQGRANYAWSTKNKTCLQSQISTTPGHSMLQLEQEYLGNDFTANVKAVNPSLAEGTGIYIGTYLQSVTPHLALGLETVYQRPTPGASETAASLVGKYIGKDFVATGTLQSFGSLSLSYVQKINEKVDVATECQILTAGARRDAVTTIAGKFEFRQATFRGQLDSRGKVSAVLEEKITPGFSFLLSGEMDHTQGQHKFGFGVMLEA